MNVVQTNIMVYKIIVIYEGLNSAPNFEKGYFKV